MSVNVNPPPLLRIPDAFLRDREIREFVKQQNTIIFQLWNRTGGVNDDVSESKENITSSSSRVSRNAARINSLELKEFDLVQVDSDITTNRNQILDCVNASPITVTLDQQAVAGDEVHVKRRGEEVLIVGSIDDSQDLIINVVLYSVHLIFNGATWISI